MYIKKEQVKFWGPSRKKRYDIEKIFRKKKKYGKDDRCSRPWKMSGFQQTAMSTGPTLVWLRYDRWNVYWKIRLKRDWDEQIDNLEWHAKLEKITSGAFCKLSWYGGQKTNGW